MNLAIFHHLPAVGGASRVLSEYVARATAHEVTVYSRKPLGEGLYEFRRPVKIEARPLHSPRGRAGRFRRAWQLPRLGRELAAEIDSGGHDAVFCHMSDFVQAPEVLPYLRTPSLYYAPEPRRGDYESIPRVLDDRPALSPWRRRLNPRNAWLRRLDRRHVRAASLVVTHSRYTAGQIESIYGIPPEIVYLGVDTELFSPGEDKRDDFVLSVGSLSPLKGHQFVLRALAGIPRPRPRLVIAGAGGGYEAELRTLAGSLDVECEIRPAVSDLDLSGLYRQAAAVACGQIREPFGLVPLEAMASGAPVVAVREGGLPESVADGETGLLTPRDPQAFGAAITRVLADRSLAARLGAEGRRAVTEKWRWEHTVEGYDALLGRLAGADRA
jgi:glycosyltransferase involved in cell wall biosynthesis